MSLGIHPIAGNLELFMIHAGVIFPYTVPPSLHQQCNIIYSSGTGLEV